MKPIQTGYMQPLKQQKLNLNFIRVKKYILFILALLYFSFGNAQTDRNLLRANKYFERAFYSEAIPLYQKSLDEGYSFKALKNIADAYYYTSNYAKAAVYYKYLVNNYSSLLEETTYFRYSETLKATNKYEKAYDVLKKYYKVNDSAKLTQLEKTIHYLENVKAIGNRFQIENLAINTENAEFGAVEKDGFLVFASPKKPEDGQDKTYGWTGAQYLDLYQIPLTEEHQASVPTPFSNTINTKLHEATIAFTQDGKTAYFSRNNFIKGKRKTDDNKITHVQIYKAELINNTWQNITLLPFNKDNFSAEHPALSPDEKTLYFSSDMPNGYGSFDLYSVAILPDGSYGLPENLGSTINTDKKEQFPFVSADNHLYFSSNGHPGFGGLDIFVSTIENNQFTQPDNIGLPVNSGYDDFSFNINSTTKKGYFSSNRTTGKGDDDIYKIVEEKPLLIEDCGQFISGTITDIDTEQTLFNVVIALKNNGILIEQTTTDNEGKFVFNANCDTEYAILASKEGYTNNSTVLALKSERKKNNDASMTLKSLVQIEKEEREALALQQEREHELRAQKALQLEIDKKHKINKAIEQEDNIVKEKGQLVIKTEEINFDYKLWYLRRDAKKAVQVVIDLMKKYPDMILEIGTHSDMRGNKNYNQELSQKRANSVRYYLIDEGINPDRITAIGYGEQQPLIQCKTEDACTEEQHELNRRCEFVVKKIY